MTPAKHVLSHVEGHAKSGKLLNDFFGALRVLAGETFPKVILLNILHFFEKNSVSPLTGDACFTNSNCYQ